jgi:hypothetical protein
MKGVEVKRQAISGGLHVTTKTVFSCNSFELILFPNNKKVDATCDVQSVRNGGVQGFD